MKKLLIQSKICCVLKEARIVTCSTIWKVVVFAAALLFLWSACTTVPKNFPGAAEGDFSLLPSGGKLYLWAKIKEARSILEGISVDGISLREASSILDRSVAATAVFNDSGSSERFFITLWGNYPSFRSGLSLAFARDWKKQKSKTGNSFWFSPSYGLGLALNKVMAFVSEGDPFNIISGGTAKNSVQNPEGFNEFREGSVMAGWILEPNDVINQFMTIMAIPIQIPAEDFYFSVLPNSDIAGKEQWELLFHIRTPSANQARAILTLFSLARIFIINNPPEITGDVYNITDFLPVLFENVPLREEDVLTLRTAALDAQELSLLFEAFSVYSKRTSLL